MTTPPTTHQLGLAEGLRIQRSHDRADWRAQLEAIEDAEVRTVAALYLRDIWRRMQAREAAHAKRRGAAARAPQPVEN